MKLEVAVFEAEGVYRREKAKEESRHEAVWRVEFQKGGLHVSACVLSFIETFKKVEYYEHVKRL